MIFKKIFCRCKKKPSVRETLAKLEQTMANVADTLLDVQAKVVALQAAVAALPTTAGGGQTDLSPVLSAVADVKTDTTAIKAELTPTVPAA